MPISRFDQGLRRLKGLNRRLTPPSALTKRLIEGEDSSRSAIFLGNLDDYIAEDNLVRVIDVFVDELDLRALSMRSARTLLLSRSATE
jgi:hypothetical protein